MAAILDLPRRALARINAGSSLNKAPTAFPGAPAGGQVRAMTNDVAAMNQRLNRDFGATGDNVQMGPGVPPIPAPLDDSGQPRQYPYRVGWNIPSQPGEGKRVDFATLKELADTYDLMGKAITIRQDELCSLRFDVTARDPDRKVQRAVIKSQQAKITAIRAFFERPDRIHTWQTWLRRLLWDHFVLDAVSIWKWRTMGGELYGLRLLDGATIKPLLSIQGDTPLPPDPAYQQYLYGVARGSYTLGDTFDAGEFIYAVKHPQLGKVYGRSPVEQFMWHVNEALRYGRARTDYFTDGTLPEGVAIAPPATSPAQLAELREWWDGVMSGDSRQLHKLQWVPAGTAFHAFKTFEFNEQYAMWLVELTALAMDVTPQQLGFQPRGAGLGGKGFSEEQTAIQKRKAVGPLTRWLCDEILNPIIWNDFDAPDLVATFIDDGDEEDQLARATAREILIRSGQMSLDQIVEEDGGTPPGIGRIFTVGNNVLFEPDLLAGSKAGAAFIPSKEIDTPGVGEKPPAAPKPGTPGSQDIIGSGKEPAADDGANARKLAEVGTFLSFVQKRRKAGTWRDFTSDVLEPDALKALNVAAKAGASADELRALVGLDEQPAAFKRRVAGMNLAYLEETERLRRAVAGKIERSA